jgi:hypothetical protein
MDNTLMPAPLHLLDIQMVEEDNHKDCFLVDSTAVAALAKVRLTRYSNQTWHSIPNYTRHQSIFFFPRRIFVDQNYLKQGIFL